MAWRREKRKRRKMRREAWRKYSLSPAGWHGSWHNIKRNNENESGAAKSNEIWRENNEKWRNGIIKLIETIVISEKLNNERK
jgi:hypothetical protein